MSKTNNVSIFLEIKDIRKGYGEGDTRQEVLQGVSFAANKEKADADLIEDIEETDMMFDALTFDIAMTTPEGWDRINAEPEYEYARCGFSKV